MCVLEKNVIMKQYTGFKNCTYQNNERQKMVLDRNRTSCKGVAIQTNTTEAATQY